MPYSALLTRILSLPLNLLGMAGRVHASHNLVEVRVAVNRPYQVVGAKREPPSTISLRRGEI